VGTVATDPAATGVARPLVVGYDGSPPSRRALAWALAEARSRSLPVRLVHCYTPLSPSLALGYGAVVPSELLDDVHDLAKAVVADGLAEAAVLAPEIAVEGHLVVGDAPATLLGLADDADLLVLGSRGLGGFRGLLLGSVSHQVGVHAKVPVVVVRGDDHPDGPVVVGIDGSSASSSALDLAFGYAQRHGLRLVALHAWDLPVFDAPGVTVPPTIVMDEIEDDEMRLTAESLAGWCEKYPDVQVEQRVVHGQAEGVVVAASQEACLIVVGSRGRGGFRGLLLGSVGLAAMHHSHCPVAVVRPS
jgi:nucleotide-binding universal stress UspA family protein